jgi:hypothetical protein
LPGPGRRRLAGHRYRYLHEGIDALAARPRALGERAAAELKERWRAQAHQPHPEPDRRHRPRRSVLNPPDPMSPPSFRVGQYDGVGLSKPAGDTRPIANITRIAQLARHRRDHLRWTGMEDGKTPSEVPKTAGQTTFLGNAG